MNTNFQTMQMGLANGVFAIAMALLLTAWPHLELWQDYGLFLSSMVILIHWHYGVSFVFQHIGPSYRLGGTLLDSLMLFCMLGIALSLKSPLTWFGLNVASYLIAWVKYRRLARLKLAPAVKTYIRRKMLVELGAAAATFTGLAWCWLLPDYVAFAAWNTFIINLIVAYVLSEVWKIYNVGGDFSK